MAKKIAIINFKGGVGKTTLAFHLATYLAKEHKVLVVDVDHQSSLSLILLGKLCPGGHPNSPTCGHPKLPHPEHA